MTIRRSFGSQRPAASAKPAAPIRIVSETEMSWTFAGPTASQRHDRVGLIEDRPLLQRELIDRHEREHEALVPA